jgi:hypothetical protein
MKYVTIVTGKLRLITRSFNPLVALDPFLYRLLVILRQSFCRFTEHEVATCYAGSCLLSVR